MEDHKQENKKNQDSNLNNKTIYDDKNLDKNDYKLISNFNQDNLNLINIGIKRFDDHFKLFKDRLNTIYGKAGSGKTTFALNTAINFVLNNKKDKYKVLFIDTEQKTSNIERLHTILNSSSILKSNKSFILNNIVFYKPKDFQDQVSFINHIKEKTIPFKLIIVDTVSNLYRVFKTKTKDNIIKQNNNNKSLKLLNKHIADLMKISRKNICILITNQMNMNKMVNHETLSYASSLVVKLDYFDNKEKKIRFLIIEKPNVLNNKKIYFKIINKGIE